MHSCLSLASIFIHDVPILMLVQLDVLTCHQEGKRQSATVSRYVRAPFIQFRVLAFQFLFVHVESEDESAPIHVTQSIDALFPSGDPSEHESLSSLRN
jgi:hypothetical protein